VGGKEQELVAQVKNIVSVFVNLPGTSRLLESWDSQQIFLIKIFVNKN